MILLEVGNLFGLVVMGYLVFHIPAFVLLFIGLYKRTKQPAKAKNFIIAALVYFIIGAGICGSMMA